MSPQGVMTRKNASYSPGLNPVKGQKFCPGTQTGSRGELSRLSLGITKTSPLSPTLVDQPATEHLLQISPRDTQGRLGSKEPQGPSDEDTTVLRNSGNCLPSDAASHTRKNRIFIDEICVCVCRSFS